jgi:CRP-like cAMP-binding protein
MSGAQGPAGSPWPATSLLGRLTGPVRTGLLELGVEVTIPAGRRLLRQDEHSDLVYLLLDGCVRICRLVDGREPLVGLSVGGDLIGEMAVLSMERRSATVITSTQIIARVVPGPRFRLYVHSHPQLLLEITNRMAERLRWAEERRGEFAVLDARTRICRILLALADSYGRDVPDGRDLGVPLTQEDIASLAGVRLNTAEKTLRALSRAGLLRLGYRRVVVIDLPRLRNAARLDNT